MVRSLWTGATGMIAQQLNVDNIANNLANVNTTGYKSEVMEFKSLLYQTIQTRTTTANGENKPIGAEVGLGVRNSSITSIFTDGNPLETPGSANFALNGNGFFGYSTEIHIIRETVILSLLSDRRGSRSRRQTGFPFWIPRGIRSSLRTMRSSPARSRSGATTACCTTPMRRVCRRVWICGSDSGSSTIRQV